MTVDDLNKKFVEKAASLSDTCCLNISRRNAGWPNSEISICEKEMIRLFYLDDINLLNKPKQLTDTVYLPF